MFFSTPYIRKNFKSRFLERQGSHKGENLAIDRSRAPLYFFSCMSLGPTAKFLQKSIFKSGHPEFGDPGPDALRQILGTQILICKTVFNLKLEPALELELQWDFKLG